MRRKGKPWDWNILVEWRRNSTFARGLQNLYSLTRVITGVIRSCIPEKPQYLLAWTSDVALRTQFKDLQLAFFLSL